MKALFLTLFLYAGFGAGLLPAAAQTAGKTAVVRLFEAPGSRLYLSYGGGKTELQELTGIVGKKDQKANTEQLQALIDRLYAEGYHLVSSFGSEYGGAPVSTLIFRKD